MSRLLSLAAAALLLTSCTSGGGDDPAGPTPSAAPTSASPTPVVAAPPPPAPAQGACYRLSYAEAVAPTNDETPVPCKKDHTSETFAVGRLDLVTNGHLLAVDSEAVRGQVAKACPAALAAYLGASEEQLRLSLLRPVWFTPTLDQGDAGAAWYRCDVIAVTGDKKLAALDHSVKDALAREDGRAEVATCGTAQPGTAAFSRVLCRDDHSWRAIKLLDLSDRAKKGGGYPGVDAVKSAGQDPCAAAARAVASDALDYQWGYEWPTEDQWQAGQTYGYCWSPDPP